MNKITNIFSNYSNREIKRLMKIVKKIEALDEKMTSLSDEELKAMTVKFKNRLDNGESLDDILPEAFAVVREASFRVLGKKHYRVQLIGGIVLHQGRVAEMKTGEGKTLVATCPTYLNALSGKGVHIITVNDYLAKRDRDEMGQIHEFLGLSVGVILSEMSPNERRDAYKCDVTYGTNSEFGFDYLRDNMAVDINERVQRKLNFAVIDEIDSIFIDEARTPLIISGAGMKSTELYRKADIFAKSLKENEDYTIDEKTKAVILTEEGIEKAENYYGIENFTLQEHMNIQHHTVIALKANYSMKMGVDYIIKDNEVMIVDQFTGRVMDGRRFNEGLHQAIEAKERVEIKNENDTLATITYQNYFKIYTKISGMSGTVITEEKEFQEIYNLDVIEIPTNRPVLRNDRKDLVYLTEMDKFKAIVEDIEQTYKIGQPVLVGTVSVDKSEIISFMLKKKGIPHQVLNAKEHKREAEIVAKAGEVGMITIATNMAGRGTDIKLSEDALKLGGLKVIGTERHEARRIDNQLRGRSGRQGDPGESVFYVSLEDEIIQRFGKDRLEKLMKKNKFKEKEAIDSRNVYKLIEKSQKNVESTHFETRKNLVKYDDILNSQRVLIYKQRNEIVVKENISEEIKTMIEDVIKSEVESVFDSKDIPKDEKIDKIVEAIRNITGIREIPTEGFYGAKQEVIIDLLNNIAQEAYKEKQEEAGEMFDYIQKKVLLTNVDRCWVQNIEEMDNLKKYIVLQSYNQKDPVVVYRIYGSEIFEETIGRIKKETVRFILNLKLKMEPLMESVAVDEIK